MKMYKERKATQKKVNKIIRELNKGIEKDNLWKGRFAFRQKDAHWFEFDDHSGGGLTLVIRGIDKETNYYKDAIIHYGTWSTLTADFWIFANDFIAKDSKVWYGEVRPMAETSKDYTNVKIDEKIMNLPENFYLSYGGGYNNA